MVARGQEARLAPPVVVIVRGGAARGYDEGQGPRKGRLREERGRRVVREGGDNSNLTTCFQQTPRHTSEAERAMTGQQRGACASPS